MPDLKSHSQCGEDIWILENLKPPVGTFLEVGAFDGNLSSNTLLFENLGWKGILIEADPHVAYSCLSRKRSRTFVCAAGTNEGRHLFFVNEQDHGLSGLNRSGKEIFVSVRRLDSIIDESKLKHINLMSIDTEGTELDVWMSAGRFRPEIVIMEYNTSGLPLNDGPIVTQMASDGYVEVYRTLYNIVFVLATSQSKL